MVRGIYVDISPRYERKIIEETDRYIIYTSEWGVTIKKLKESDSTPEFLDYTVKTPEAWEAAKKRMAFDPSRVDLGYYKREYPKWQADGSWIQAGFWFGFDVTHSWMTGTETLLVAMLEEPEWVEDIFGAYLDSCIKYFDLLWDGGVRFDSVMWPDDMGYKGTQFFSLNMYRNIIKPYHKAACDWAHNRGIYAHLHSCGNIMSFVPDLLEIGIDALNPLEVKAGMDSFELKRLYGDRLVLHGGINAVLWDKPGEIIPEMERVIPVLKQNGGYIFSSDHSVPNTVSLESFKMIVARAKELGRY
jgi:uroporphyrinogen decarboxylase